MIYTITKNSMNFICSNYDMFLEELKNPPLQEGKGKGKTSKPVKTLSNKIMNTFINSGWSKNKTLSKYKNLNDKILNTYYTNFSHSPSIVLDIAENEIERHKYKIYNLSKSLQKLGIRKSISLYLEELFYPFIDNSFSYKQVLYKCVEYAVYPHEDLVKDPNVHYFYKENILNTWIPYKDSQIYNIDVNCSKHNISIINKNIIKNIKDNDSILFYHTTNWKSSIAIMEFIHHTAGRACLDFGYLPGFYCSNDIRDALGWGYNLSKQKNNEIAIVIFKIPKIINSDISLLDIKNNIFWNKIVTKSRLCTPKPILNELIELREIDLVYGKMLANPTNVENGEHPLTHNPPKFQLASKTTMGDRFLQECLVGSIVFQK
jgi:hypothetical protein